MLGAYDNNECDGASVLKANAKEACNVLQMQNSSGQVIGINSSKEMGSG